MYIDRVYVDQASLESVYPLGLRIFGEEIVDHQPINDAIVCKAGINIDTFFDFVKAHFFDEKVNLLMLMITFLNLISLHAHFSILIYNFKNYKSSLFLEPGFLENFFFCFCSKNIKNRMRKN